MEHTMWHNMMGSIVEPARSICHNNPFHCDNSSSYDLLLASVLQNQPLHFMESLPIHTGCWEDACGLHSTTDIVQGKHVVVRHHTNHFALFIHNWQASDSVLHQAFKSCTESALLVLRDVHIEPAVTNSVNVTKCVKMLVS